MAAGSRRAGETATPWHAGLAGGESAADWWDFLNSLPADPPPRWVVADGAKAIRSAVTDIWPDAIFFPCIWHLRERLREVAGDLTLRDPALEPAIDVAFRAAHHWERLIAIARPLGDTSLWSWITANDKLVRSLDDLRRLLPEAPEANGAAEAMAVAVRARIGSRRSNFTNARRLDIVIGLMTADLAGLARTAAYLRVIRGDLDAAGWVLGSGDPTFWERGHDREDANEMVQASIADLIVASRDRARIDLSEMLRTSQTGSVERKVAAANVERTARGLAPLVATVAPGRAVASVKVAGTFLRDYPEILADWDPDNPWDPQVLTAGVPYVARWICAACGYRWEAPIVRRTARQTRCARCHKPWGLPELSLAATHPELVAVEWVRDANLPVLPQVVSARNGKTVIWRCADFPGVHPDYPMSPKARVKAPIGCPVCRHAISAAKRRKPRPDDALPF